MLVTRRQALGSISLPVGLALGAPVLASLRGARAQAVAREAAEHAQEPARAASDGDFWAHIASAFTQDRSVINLNNGGVSPSPSVVQDAVKRNMDYSNSAPPPYALWEILEPQREGVRAAVAKHWGVDPEEIAFTRNASESLQICLFGIDLRSGDEILTTDQDYPRMINTLVQRERREGVVLRTFPLPVPCESDEQLVRLFEQHITPRTRMILMCHIINLTGQILPVKKVVRMARARGIPVVVDGAHALAHFSFGLSDLDCDYYGVSLHKWLFAPHGTGLLYVRRDKIASLWPMMAPPPDKQDDIRKFEEIGTHPAAPALGIGDALVFHQGIGDARKESRLRFLRDYWAGRLTSGPARDRVRLHTSLDPRFSCGIGNVQIDGLDARKLADWLWEKHKILVVAIRHAPGGPDAPVSFQGIRVTPSVYTTLPELDRFCDAVEWAAAHGIPA